MTSARDVDQQELVEKTSEELKKRLGMPSWASYVKTGVSRERPPEHLDWWWKRSASILRKVYLDGPIGTSKLRSFHGGLHRRGHKPAHFAKAGGKIIRTILQDLERSGLIEKVNKPKKGRVITKEGQRFLDRIAKQIK